MSGVELITVIVGVMSGALGAGMALGVMRGTVVGLRTDVDHLQTLCRAQSARIDELYQTILQESR